MNVADWLQGTLSPEQALRDDCTRKLQAAYETNYVQYITALVQELVNANGEVATRTAAALAFKNALSATDEARKTEKAQNWAKLDGALRQQIKAATLGNLESGLGNQTAQVIAAIAAIDLPRNEWNELIPALLANMTNVAASEALKANSMTAIGFVCELIDPSVLSRHADSILGAVMNGARKEEPSAHVRKQAFDALSNSLDFIQENFGRDAERNVIMQVLCEGTQAQSVDVQVAAYQCLIRVVDQYYKYMEMYMRKALFGVTIFSMQSEIEAVVLQAIEFWSTLCEREYDVMYAVEEAHLMGMPITEKCYHFAREVLKELVPVLFWLLTKVDEDADEDDWNPSMAASTCLNALASTVGGDIINFALPLIEQNIRSLDWHHRDAAVMTFGSILDGPEPRQLAGLVSQAMPFLLDTTQDQHIVVKDTAAWTLGRICEFVVHELSDSLYAGMIEALVRGLGESQPRIVSSSSWALMQFAEQFEDRAEDPTSVLSAYYEHVISALLAAAARDGAQALRTGAYQALTAWIASAAEDSLPVVQRAAEELMLRVEFCAQQASLHGAVAETTSNLLGVMTAVIRRLEKQAAPAADRIMASLTQLAQLAVTSKATGVVEDVLLCTGALASVLEHDFERFMNAILPVVVGGLQSPDEHLLCEVAVGTVSDMCRALEAGFATWAGGFMELLGAALTRPGVHPSLPPVIISCFGDIALAIGGAKFTTYLDSVMTVLQQAAYAAQTMPEASPDFADILEHLREAIVVALVGIVNALAEDQLMASLEPHLHFIASTMFESIKDNRRASEAVSRNVAGLIGDLALAFGPSARDLLTQEWVERFLAVMIQSHAYSSATRETARWARDQVRGIAM
ncbi:karyopherin Kap95 [Blastocladiella emersonii ATCC 22665]|nr:karyopherin Kap95 [Blastocladiella emersonii ATCC 22665]